MSRNSYISWDVVRDVANRLRQRQIPADVLHLIRPGFGKTGTAIFAILSRALSESRRTFV